MLWINPHTSYYFRSELQMVSEQGLNVYGAVTWGQFFVYQGFNAHNGWMHTSYGGDAIDEYAEDLVKKPDGLYYDTAAGCENLGQRDFHQGAARRRPDRSELHGVSQPSWPDHSRRKWPVDRHQIAAGSRCRRYRNPTCAPKPSTTPNFRKTQDMRTDTSNNTVYADADGTIAYFHGNFIPKRDTSFDFTHPVDGSNPATEWQGPHAVADTITLLNPSNGWLFNSNNWPFSAAGRSESEARELSALHVDARARIRAALTRLRFWSKIRGVTLDSLIAAGYDGASDRLRRAAAAAIRRVRCAARGRSAARLTRRRRSRALRAWNRRTSADSVRDRGCHFLGPGIDRTQRRRGPRCG